MDILEKAISFATDRHKSVVRKGTQVPYIVHPMEAVSIAAGMTNDLEVLAAAALHDVVEDTPTTIDEIEEVFGKRVAALVAFDSEDKMPDIPPSESWEIRKKATIASLQDAPLDAKIIVLADKLSNIRSINREIINIGDAVWEKFNQKDKKKHEWYYREIANALSMGIHKLSEHFAYQEFYWLLDMVFVTSVYEEKITDSQKIKEITEEVLQCNPKKLADDIWKRIVWRTTSAYTRLDLLRMVPFFNTGEKIRFSTADEGCCPDIIRRNNTNAFRWTLLTLVRSNMENKAVQIDMKYCLDSDKDGRRDWIRSCYLEARYLKDVCHICGGAVTWEYVSIPNEVYSTSLARMCLKCGNMGGVI